MSVISTIWRGYLSESGSPGAGGGGGGGGGGGEGSGISLIFFSQYKVKYGRSTYGIDGILSQHDGVNKWKHFPRYWPFVRGIHRSAVNSLHKGQWRGALMFYLICARINAWVNNGEAGNLRRHRSHYDVTVMFILRSNVHYCQFGLQLFDSSVWCSQVRHSWHDITWN